MTGPWQILRTILREAEKSYHGYGAGGGPAPKKLKSAAEYKRDLFKLITQRFGEAETDDVAVDMKRLGSFDEFKKHMALKYMSDDIDSIIKDMGKAVRATQTNQPGAQSAKQARAGSVQGRSGREYVPADVAAQKQADIYAMRQARQTAGQSDPEIGSLMTPGKGGGHAMGTAGQNSPKVQPSVAQGINPAVSAADLKGMRVSRSGLVKAQRDVDKETKENGEKAGERLAAQLGVPSTKQRTVTDKETGEPRIQIWGPDRVMKAMDPDQRDLPVAGPGQKASSMKGTELPKQSPDELRRQASNKRSALAAKNEPDQDRIDKIKQGVIARNKAAGTGFVGAGPIAPGAHQTGEPKRPPNFDFEELPMRGTSQTVDTSRPDAATGNWIRGKRTVDPSKTGPKWTGYKGKWYTKDQIEKMFPGKDEPSSKDLVTRAMARAGTVPMQGKTDQPIKKGQTAASDFEMDDEDDEYPEDQGWKKA